MNLDLNKCFICGNDYKLSGPYYNYFKNICIRRYCDDDFHNHHTSIISSKNELLTLDIYVHEFGNYIFEFSFKEKNIRLAKLIDSRPGKIQNFYFEPDFSNPEKIIKRLKTILIFQ